MAIYPIDTVRIFLFKGAVSISYYFGGSLVQWLASWAPNPRVGGSIPICALLL